MLWSYVVPINKFIIYQNIIERGLQVGLLQDEEKVIIYD